MTFYKGLIASFIVHGVLILSLIFFSSLAPVAKKNRLEKVMVVDVLKKPSPQKATTTLKKEQEKKPKKAPKALQNPQQKKTPISQKPTPPQKKPTLEHKRLPGSLFKNTKKSQPQKNKGPRKKKAPKKKSQESFENLLKDLSPSKKGLQNPKATAQETASSLVSQVVSQFQHCWVVPGSLDTRKAGIITLKVTLDRQGWVRKVSSLTTPKNGLEQALLESAYGAVKDKRCQPLSLPPEHYSLWQEVTLHFDPSEMG